jgi:hypothetical protein
LANGNKDHIPELLRTLPVDHAALTFEPRPYLATPSWAREKLIEWGEDSPLWESKVRGQFPQQAEDALIALKWLEAAREPKVIEADENKLYAGIDVAAGGGDETVCAVRTQHGRIVAQGAWYGYSTGPVIQFLNPYKGRLREINYDSAGPGEYFDVAFEVAGFRNMNGVNVGMATDFTDRFKNLKAQLYWGLRERFMNGMVSGLDDDLAITQLASIKYEINPRGQIEIESKDDMKKRGLKSPDRAEALMLCFANRTPGIAEFYREQSERPALELAHEKATQAAIAKGLEPPAPLEPLEDGSELQKAYDDVINFGTGWDDDGYSPVGDKVCTKCGGAFEPGETITDAGVIGRFHKRCFSG